MPMQFVSSHCDYWMKEGKDEMDVDCVYRHHLDGIRIDDGDDDEGGNDDEHLYYTIG
jgi:hypothetical protein